MDDLLKRKLKSGKSDERYSAIKGLGRLATDEAVFDLKRVAEGKRRVWLRWYDSDDQICALRALADLSSEDTKKYVEHYFQEVSFEVHSNRTSNAFMQIPNWACCEHTFPNARGKLAKRLKYHSPGHYEDHMVTQWGAEPGCLMPRYESSNDEGFKAIKKDEEAHRARDEILKKIRS